MMESALGARKVVAFLGCGYESIGRLLPARLHPTPLLHSCGGGCVEEGDVEGGRVEEPAEVRQRAQAQVEKPAREQDQATAIMLQQLLELERELKLTPAI